jgi:VCBS repeat-containing protein
MNIRKTLLVAMMAVVVFACKDDDESPSKTSLLSKKWKVTKYEMAGIDVTEFYSEGDCENDDYLEFKADGTFLEEVGAEACFSGDVDGSGTWAFKENESILTIDYADEDAEDFKVKQLDGSTMKLSITDDDFNQELTITFTKI